MSEQIIGPNRCMYCGGEYGDHDDDCRRPKPPPSFADQLIAELRKREEFWRNQTNDPYNIANAVSVTLAEVRNAIEDARGRKGAK